MNSESANELQTAEFNAGLPEKARGKVLGGRFMSGVPALPPLSVNRGGAVNWLCVLNRKNTVYIILHCLSNHTLLIPTMKPLTCVS